MKSGYSGNEDIFKIVAPNGKIYDLAPKKTYENGFIRCLSDIIILPPSYCGCAIKMVSQCITSTYVGKWSMSQVDAAGNWVNETKEVEEVEKTCINKTIVRECFVKNDCPFDLCCIRERCVECPPPPPECIV